MGFGSNRRSNGQPGGKPMDLSLPSPEADRVRQTMEQLGHLPLSTSTVEEVHTGAELPHVAMVGAEHEPVPVAAQAPALVTAGEK